MEGSSTPKRWRACFEIEFKLLPYYCSTTRDAHLVQTIHRLDIDLGYQDVHFPACTEKWVFVINEVSPY